MEYELVLAHHGVKGMKWGVRKAREAKRDLNQKERAYKQAKSRYKNSTKIAREQNRKDYKQTKSDYKSAKKEFKENAPARVKAERAAEKGAKAAASALANIGFSYYMDQTFNAGRGTKAAKDAIQAIGILSVTAIARARGATDIHWYDKQGRKIV